MSNVIWVWNWKETPPDMSPPLNMPAWRGRLQKPINDFAPRQMMLFDALGRSLMMWRGIHATPHPHLKTNFVPSSRGRLWEQVDSAVGKELPYLESKTLVYSVSLQCNRVPVRVHHMTFPAPNLLHHGGPTGTHTAFTQKRFGHCVVLPKS